MEGFLGKMHGKKVTETFVVKPSTLPPPPPKKRNIDEVEDENVNKINNELNELYEFRSNYTRISHEFRSNYTRISHEFRSFYTNFARISLELYTNYEH